MVPRFIIILLFIAAFMGMFLQYYKVNAQQRILNLRFAMMVGAIAGAIGYNLIVQFFPDNRRASWLFLALALFWLASAYRLWRRMPVRRE
jgi:hypothetical protein